MKHIPSQPSFEEFYYTKVGMGEACGCAERIIDVHEFNRKGGRKIYERVRAQKPKTSWAGVLRRLGLLSRREG